MASRQQDYYDKVYDAAKSLGWSDAKSRLAASQSTLETGGGKSAPGNAFFGIKAGPNWDGPKQTLMTWEEENGQRVNQPATFRSYDNPNQSLVDWNSTLQENWPDASAAANFSDAVAGLQDGKYGAYATDSGYGSKLRSIDRANNGPYRSLMPDVASVPTPTFRDFQSLAPADEAPQTIANQSTQPTGLLGYMAEQDARPSAFNSVLNGPKNVTMLDPNEMQGNFLAEHTKPGEMQVTPQLSMSRFAANPAFSPAAPTPSYADVTPDQKAALAAGLNAVNADIATATPEELAAGIATPDRFMAPTLPGQVPQAPTPPGQAAPTPGYVDPQVVAATQPTSRAPAAPRAPQAVDYTTTASAPIGFDAATQAAASQAAQNTGLLDKAQSTHGRNAALGGLLGLGLGGPLGAILGLAVANNLSNKSQAQQAAGYYPDAPSFTGRLSQLLGIDTGGGGRDSLNEHGRDVYNDSGQFRSATDKKSAGLY